MRLELWLGDALWVYMIAYKSLIGMSPYRIIYRKACHLLMELEHKPFWVIKQCNFNYDVHGGYKEVAITRVGKDTEWCLQECKDL